MGIKRTPSFHNLTQEQKDRYCNGCGPKGGFVPVPEFFFHASCLIHDFYYTCGGTEDDRKVADDLFYAAMKKDVRSLFFLRRPYAYLLAWLYYRAVRRWGKACFNYAPRPYTIEELDLLWNFEKNKFRFLQNLREMKGLDK